MCEHIINVCNKHGIKAKRFAIADEIKRQLHLFIKTQFGVDIYNCTDAEKTMVRPIMVDWGLIKREKSQGQYLTNLLQADIDEAFRPHDWPMLNGRGHIHSGGNIPKEVIDLAIVTDIRYSQYPEDEVYWVQEKNDGALVHIKKKVGEDEIGEPVFTLPPNEQEMLNDPILQECADYHVEWDMMEGQGVDRVIHDLPKYYDAVAEELLKRLEII
jgi:hypothetical protein